MRHRAAFEEHELQRHAMGGAAENTSVLATDRTPFTWWANFSRCLLKGFEHTWGLRYDMCYGGGFDADGLTSGTAGDPDNPNAYPYFDIPGGMYNASGYANAVFHAARQDPRGYPAKHCEPSWKDQTNWATKWASEAIEDAELRAAIDSELGR
eukprot:SAG31_NODE_2838_length_5017_cov_3.102074_4_plen_153_part_00